MKMKKKLNHILLVPSAVALLMGISGESSAAPFARLKDETLQRINVGPGGSHLQRLTVFQNKAFEFSQDTYLEGIDEQNISQLPSQMLFKKGTILNVVKTRKDTQGVEWAQVYTDREDEVVDTLPALVWVPLEDIIDSNVVMIDLQDPFDEDGNEIASLEEETTVMEFMINGKKKSVVRRRGGMTYCYRFVKMRLVQLGLVKSKLPGGSAYMAASILPSHGFSRTGRGPGSAQINDVCVYSGGRGGHGHIEIKTSGGWWYGYGNKSSPIRGRAFIACFSK